MSFNFFKSILTKVFCASSNDEYSSLLDNPYTSEEEKAAIRNEINMQEHQPGIPFSRLTTLYRSNSDDKWDGLRFSLNFKPNQLYSMDYTMIIEKGKRLFDNIQTGCMCFIPTIQSNGIMLVGRKDPPNSLVLQSHFILSSKDKLAVIGQYPKDDMNQALYTAEYSHDFDRITTAVKCSTVDPLSASAIAPLYRNLFIGIEAYKIPGDYQFGYNYSLWLKNGPRNRLGIAFNYLTTLPGIICDMTYRINNNFNFYMNGSYTWNPMIVQMGSSPASAKISSNYVNENLEVDVEMNLSGYVNLITSFNILKNFALQMNIGINTKGKFTKRSIKNFGLGLKMSTSTIEEGLRDIAAQSMEDNVQEYSYDKLSKKI